MHGFKKALRGFPEWGFDYCLTRWAVTDSSLPLDPRRAEWWLSEDDPAPEGSRISVLVQFATAARPGTQENISPRLVTL